MTKPHLRKTMSKNHKQKQHSRYPGTGKQRWLTHQGYSHIQTSLQRTCCIDICPPGHPHFYLQTSILVFKRPIRLRHSCQESKEKNHVCPQENRKWLCRNFNNWCEIQTYSPRWVYQICSLKYTIKCAQDSNNFHYQDGLWGVWEPVDFICVCFVCSREPILASF